MKFDKPKRIKRTTLKRQADILFSKHIRSLGRCELKELDHISCSGQLQTMHIIGRSNYNLRWDEFNALCGCSGHHRWYTSHPFEFFQLVKRYFPRKYNYVSTMKNVLWDKDYFKILKQYE